MLYNTTNHTIKEVIRLAIKLVASDLDGTIVSDNEYIHKSNLEAINMLNDKKVNFAICTGKSYSVSKDLCNKCHADYGIFSNGSQIYNLKTGDKIYSNTLLFSDVKICFEIAKKHNLHVHAYSDNCLITEKLEYLDLRNFKLQKFPGFSFIVVPNVLDYIERNNLSIQQFVISSLNSLADIKEQILNNAKISISHVSKSGRYKDKILNKEYEYLSIIPYNTSKSTAVNFLSDYLSINKEDTIAIGDNLNDIDMIKDSGIGIAVANAYNEVKDIADYTTYNSASEGGFAEALYKFL